LLREQNAAGYGNLPAMAREYATGAARFNRRLFGFKSRLAFRAGGHSAASGGRIGELERASVHLVFLQVSPQMEEMERFSKLVIKPHALRSAAS
jgi:hypothetical protein